VAATAKLNMKAKIYYSVLFVLFFSQGHAQSKVDSTKTKALLFVNGMPSHDSVKHTHFDRIDFIKGKQAIELFGARAKEGVFLLSSDGKIPVYGFVTTTKGKIIPHAEVTNEMGVLLTKTNKCGSFFISSHRLYEHLVIHKNGYNDLSIEVTQTELKIKLTEKK
jgi:hypothetical protein